MVTILLIVFLLALCVLALWWTFNTIRQIQLQREYAALPLTSVVKLWKKAHYIPEDAKDRESLYLYRDFLDKFEDENRYPIMLKNGGVRPMTRQEYDNLCHQKDKRPFSLLLGLAAVGYGAAAVFLNLSNLWLGILLAVILPALMVVLGLFVSKFNRDKNHYRNQIFAELKEHCGDFLRITKPFLIADAYPKTFGREGKPRFVAIGEITPEQIKEVKDYVIRQKSAETKVVLKSVDNTEEIKAIKDPEAKERAAREAAEREAAERAQAEQQAAAQAQRERARAAEEEEKAAKLVSATAPLEIPEEPKDKPLKLSEKEKQDLIQKILHDRLEGEMARAEKRMAQENQPKERIKPLKPMATEEVAPAAAPDPDDFSLDSIGIALDNEIARRRKRL